MGQGTCLPFNGNVSTAEFDPMAVPRKTEVLIPTPQEADLEGGLPHAPSLEHQQSISAALYDRAASGFMRLASRISEARDPVATEICGTGTFLVVFSRACACARV